MKINSRQRLTRIILIIVLLAIVIYIAVTTQNRASKEDMSGMVPDTISLFNGIDLHGWTAVLKDPSANPDSTFYVQDDMILSSGEPFGYLRTNRSFSHYQLLVEWRWPGEPTNSGVFIHIQEKDTIWPLCLECQLKHGRAGDFVAFPGVVFNEYLNRDSWAVPMTGEASEKPAGEWNHYDIRVNGDSVTIFVNGIMQNTATGLNVSKGFIALQSEGGPIQFRNIQLISLEPHKTK